MCRDHDLEGMTDGFDAPTAYGQIEGYEDPSMGWSRCVGVCVGGAAGIEGSPLWWTILNGAIATTKDPSNASKLTAGSWWTAVLGLDGWFKHCLAGGRLAPTAS